MSPGKAFDFAGKELWTRDLPKDYGQFGIQFGYASSPLLHGDVRAPGHGYTIPTPRVLVLHARGADQLPSLFGALIAGGHQGKSELIHGYTESVVQVHPDLHPGAVASALAEDIRRCTGSIAIEHAFDEDSEPDPGSTDDRWHVRSGDGFVSVLSPMHRAGRLPWEIQSGLGLSDDFCAHRG